MQQHLSICWSGISSVAGCAATGQGEHHQEPVHRRERTPEAGASGEPGHAAGL